MNQSIFSVDQTTNLEIAAFKAKLEAGGVEAAIEFLNSRTPFRYSAIFRLEGDQIRNLYLYDREHQTVSQPQPMPLRESFCQIVVDEGTFTTAHSAVDARVDGHAKQGVLNAYFGLPLVDTPGSIFGTFCHFDPEPKSLDTPEIPFLEAVTPLLMPYLK